MARSQSFARAARAAVDQRSVRSAQRWGWLLKASALLSIALNHNPAGAQITPSQALQQRLQEDQLRLRLLEFDDEQRSDQPLIEAAPRRETAWSGSLQLNKLTLSTTLPKAQDLQQQLQRWVGQTISDEQLREIRLEIETWYWDLDRAVSVTVAQVNTDQGSLMVQVSPLVLDAVQVAPNPAHHLSDQQAINTVTRAVPLGSELRPGKIESALLKLNDLWGVDVRARLESGTGAAGRILVLLISDRNRTGALLEVDNYLNRYVGTLRTLATVNAANHLGRGERFWVNPSWWGSGQGTGTAPLQLGFDWPLGDNGLILSGSANAGRYRLVNTGSTLYTGDTAGISLSLLQPLWRRDEHSLWLRFSGEGLRFRDARQELNVDDKRGGVFRAAVIGSSSDRWLGQGFTSWVLGGSVGSLNLDGNPAFKRFDAFTTQLQGTYGALNLNLVREQSFNRAWSARWLLLGQWALTNLSGYEQCGLGWPNGVRAYPPGENSSSSCLVSQVDLNWRLRPWLKLIGFADLAWGERWRQPFPGSLQPNSYGLAGAGLGFDLGRTGSWLVSLRAAFPIGGNPADNSFIDLEAGDPTPQLWAGLQLWL